MNFISFARKYVNKEHHEKEILLFMDSKYSKQITISRFIADDHFFETSDYVTETVSWLEKLGVFNLSRDEEIMVFLPSKKDIAAIILALLHGFFGRFPQILVKDENEGRTKYELANIVNLQEVREIGLRLAMGGQHAL